MQRLRQDAFAVAVANMNRTPRPANSSAMGKVCLPFKLTSSSATSNAGPFVACFESIVEPGKRADYGAAKIMQHVLYQHGHHRLVLDDQDPQSFQLDGAGWRRVYLLLCHYLPPTSINGAARSVCYHASFARQGNRRTALFHPAKRELSVLANIPIDLYSAVGI